MADKKCFDETFEHIVGVEGGYTDDPKDRGNWTSGKCGVGECKGTKYGISAMAYPDLDIKNLTLDKAKELFKKDYWDKCKCDQLPNAIAIAVVDCGYNSGNSRACKILQKCIGATEDGIIGSKSLKAVNDYGDKQKLLWTYRDERLAYLQTVSTWNIYGKGWTNRVNKIHDFAASYL